MKDEIPSLAEKFSLISYKNIRARLDKLSKKTSVLTPGKVLAALLSEALILKTRSVLHKDTKVLVTPEEVVGAIRRLLNEAAATEMDAMKISLPEIKRRTRKKRKPADSARAEATDAGKA